MDCQATSSFPFTQGDPAPLPAPPPWPAQRLRPAQRRGSRHPGSRVGPIRSPIWPATSGQPEVPLPAGRHSPEHALTRLRARVRSGRGPLLPARHQSLAASTGPGLGVDRSQFVPRPSSNCSAISSTGTSPWARCTTSSHGAVEPARAISRRCDLAGVRIGAHDEIFQASQPVLVGVDTASTYCYLLSLEDHRDAETWGVRLLELVDQGFASRCHRRRRGHRPTCRPGSGPARGSLPGRRLPRPP